MTLDAARLAWFAAIVVAGVWATYWPRIRRLRVPPEPTLEQGAMIGGAVLALLALASSPRLETAIIALLVLFSAGFFLATTLTSRLPAKPVALRLGDRILDFDAPDWKGQQFQLSSLSGHPFLLKFYRGYWCPYCVAELEHWERMRPHLEGLGLTVVTVSPDNVEETAKLRAKYGFGMTMLTDESLAVTNLYNVRHENGFAATPGKRGMRRPLAIPTAILVDADGLVRWIDRADDYRIRTDTARVLAAVRNASSGSTSTEARETIAD